MWCGADGLRANDQAGLLQRFPGQGLLVALARVDPAAGELVKAFGGAFDHGHRAAPDNDAAHGIAPVKRPGGIVIGVIVDE